MLIKDSSLVKNKDKLAAVNRQLVESIIQRTNLSEIDIETLDIEMIEKKIGIRAKAKKLFFDWENSEKDGWQNLKFVDEKKLCERELRMDKELMSL